MTQIIFISKKITFGSFSISAVLKKFKNTPLIWYLFDFGLANGQSVDGGQHSLSPVQTDQSQFAGAQFAEKLRVYNIIG
jgi:hypothetical protein